MANNQLNNFDINCLPIAASNYIGKANIYDTDADHTYSVTVNKNLNPETENIRIIEIETTTLDHIVEQEKIAKIDLIKIDVETHEPEVLEGYKNHLLAHKPSILIEILSDEIGKRIQEIIAPLNFLYFNIGESNGIRQVNNITKSDHFNFLLCDKATARFLKLI
jgi:FkbM family methyltransferase